MNITEVSKERAKELLNNDEVGMLTKFTIIGQDKELILVDLFDGEGKYFLVAAKDLGIERNGESFIFMFDGDKRNELYGKIDEVYSIRDHFTRKRKERAEKAFKELGS